MVIASLFSKLNNNFVQKFKINKLIYFYQILLQKHSGIYQILLIWFISV